MSDITEGINCNSVSFADDTSLYSAINSVTDCDDLQADLENIYKWADTNNMKFNSKKFQYINFGIHPEDKGSNVYVGPDLNLINASKTVKDLGVTMSMIVCLINTFIMLSKYFCNYVDGYFKLSKQEVHY